MVDELKKRSKFCNSSNYQEEFREEMEKTAMQNVIDDRQVKLHEYKKELAKKQKNLKACKKALAKYRKQLVDTNELLILNQNSKETTFLKKSIFGLEIAISNAEKRISKLKNAISSLNRKISNLEEKLQILE
jgi:predicted  nucleic acid-binding Zn-ribbon protein